MLAVCAHFPRNQLKAFQIAVAVSVVDIGYSYAGTNKPLQEKMNSVQRSKSYLQSEIMRIEGLKTLTRWEREREYFHLCDLPGNVPNFTPSPEIISG
jgi:hypothetical protein